MLEGVLGRVRDLRGNHFALIQMALFMLLDLVHRLGKGVKRKENQVGIIFDGDQRVDRAAQLIEQDVKRRRRDEIAFTPMFIRGKGRHHGNIVPEQTASIDLRPGHRRFDFLNRQIGVRQNQNVQRVDFKPQGRQRHGIVGKRQRPEGQRL